MKTRSLAHLLAFSALTIGAVAATVSAQPAATPTKTPTLEAALMQPTSQPTDAPAAQPVSFEPLTQQNLNVLTGNVQRPNGIAWFNDTLYVSCAGDSTVYEIQADDGATRTYLWGIRNAHTLYVEEGEANRPTLWIPDYQSNALAVMGSGGVETVVEDLEGPWGIQYWDEESFLVTNLLGDNVTQITRDGEVEVVLDGLEAPTGIARDGDIVYVANNGSSRRAIEWYDMSAPGDSEDALLVSGLQSVTGMQLAEDGNLYFAYSLGTRGVVGRVNPSQCRENGGCTNEQVEIVLYTELNAPLAGLSVSPDMRLFVHTMFSPDIFYVDLAQVS